MSHMKRHLEDQYDQIEMMVEAARKADCIGPMIVRAIEIARANPDYDPLPCICIGWGDLISGDAPFSSSSGGETPEQPPITPSV